MDRTYHGLILVRRNPLVDITQVFTLAVSVLFLTTILAGAPIYLNTIESLGLRSVLTTISLSNRNLQISVDNFPLTSRSISAATDRINISLEELGSLPIAVTQESHTRLHYWGLDRDSIIPGRSSDSAVLQRFEGFSDHVDFVEGRVPVSDTQIENGIVVGETAVPYKRAEILGVNVGDDIWLASNPADPAYLRLKVVGRFNPIDLTDEFWFDLGFEATEPPAPSLIARHPLPLFVAGESQFDLVTGGPASIGSARWLVELDFNQINDQGPAATEWQIEAVARSLRSEFPESDVISPIPNRFSALREQITFARIPTLMMGGVVLVAAGFFSITSVGALIARRRVDMGRLRARGSDRSHIAVAYLYETAPIVLIPALLSPFVAAGIILSIGHLSEYEAITLGMGMPVRIVWQSFALSLTGGFAVLLFIQWMANSGALLAIDSGRLNGTRVEGQPGYQRHYLDLILLLFGGIVLWDLTTEESVVVGGATHLADISPLLVFSPAIFLGVTILVSLRVMPLIARLISSGLSKRGPAGVHILSATLARLRVSYAWPIAIVATATGALILSSTVAGTLEQSAVDQSGYQSGSDIRAVPVDFYSGTRTEVIENVRNIEGVSGASLGLRAIGSMRDGGEGPPFDFLAVEPAEFAGIGIFRNDYSTEPLKELLLVLEPESDLDSSLLPMPLAINSTHVGLRVKASSSQEYVRASLRLMDAAGRSWSVNLGRMDSTEWELRMNDVPEQATKPVDVVGIIFFEQTNDELGIPMSIYVDAIVSGNAKVDGEVASGVVTTVDSLDIVENWLPLASVKGIDTAVEGFEELRGSQISQGLLIDLGVGTNKGFRGVIRTSTDAVPVLFSREALIVNGSSVGDRTVLNVFEQSIPARIVGELEYFPTIDPGKGGFVVADANQLWTYLSMSSANSAGFLSELFIGLDDPNDQSVISEVSEEIAGIHNLISRQELLDSSLVSPLAVSGWRGSAIVTTVVAMLLGTFGFLAFSAIRPTGDRYNLAVLSCLGMSRLELTVVSIGEQLVVLFTGVVGGVIVGLLMARLSVDATTQTFAEGRVLPTIVSSTDWTYLIGFVGLLIVSVIWITSSYAITVRRTELAVAVRSP